MLAVLALPVLLAWSAFQPRTRKTTRWLAHALAAVIALALGVTLYAAMQPQPLQTAHGVPAPVPGTGVGVMMEGEWRHWGRTPSGTRYAPLDQITPENVTGLENAWVYRTGEIPTSGQTHVVTPLHVDGMLYGCTQSSCLFALDADTGEERWSFDPKTETGAFRRCRGVGLLSPIDIDKRD